MEDEQLWAAFGDLAEAFARGEVLEAVAAALSLGQLTALKKKGGGVRGVVVGSILRKLVAKTLAQSSRKQSPSQQHPTSLLCKRVQEPTL